MVKGHTHNSAEIVRKLREKISSQDHSKHFLLNVQILQNYKDSSRIRRLLKNLDFYVLPVLNIDGYIYTWTTVSTLSLVLG